jgi:SOS-response transcriptional repressor LexA
VTDHETKDAVPTMFTVRQGEYLAFIHSYTTKVGVSPSFEDIARHFGTATPNVNGMIKTLERRGLLSRTPGAARSLRVLVPAEVLPGSDFGSSVRRGRTPTVAAGARSPSAADAAVTATLAVLEVVMPRLASAMPRSSGSKVVTEVARAVYESLDRLGMEDSQAAEASQRVSAERARWARGGARRHRSSMRVEAPLKDSGTAGR